MLTMFKSAKKTAILKNAIKIANLRKVRPSKITRYTVLKLIYYLYNCYIQLFSPASLSWRDMWALVTVKGAGPIAEDVGKSVDTASWGSKVTLDATVPLKDSAGNNYEFYNKYLHHLYTRTQRLNAIGRPLLRIFAEKRFAQSTKVTDSCVTVPRPSPSHSHPPM